MIEVQNLTKRFADKTAVNDVTFSVARGEVLGFLGPNGAGKSTAMKMICGYLTPDQGSVRIQGTDVHERPVEAKRRIGYLPEGMPLYADMPVHAYLAFNARVRGFRGHSVAHRIANAVSAVQLQDVLTQPIFSLSKGYKRRVGLAQALIHDPPVLVLDEPTDGLDPLQKDHVHRLIRSIAKDKAIILSTHILEEVAPVCSRVIIVNHGRIVADKAANKLAQESKLHNSIRLQVLEVKPDLVIREFSGMQQVLEVKYNAYNDSYLLVAQNGQSIVEQVWTFIEDRNWKVRTLTEEKGKLEDVFRSVTQN